MSYDLLQLPYAMRQLRHLGKTHNPQIKEIIETIMSLAQNPRPTSSKKLVGRPEWRVRVGVYRALYLIDDANRTVTISAVAHRRDVYE